MRLYPEDMETKFKNTYRIKTTRLKNWDYGSHGFYFVTICTKNKQPYFGRIINNTTTVETQDLASLQTTPMGDIAHQYWNEIPKHFPFAELDVFIIMPDHVHGLLFFNKSNYNDWKPNSFKPQSKNLASVIRGYKAAVKKYATLSNFEFAWQARYYDRVIHAEPELHATRKYIEDNPTKWLNKPC